MKISISATNPCHLFPMAAELGKLGCLGHYYSGYPRVKLSPPEGLPVRTHSARTTLVYGALKFLPPWARPRNRSLFWWQDRGFDAWVGRHLEPCDFIHAMPGQALATFRAARKLGFRTVLNHATGPVREWVRILAPEYRRAGLEIAEHSPYDAAYFIRAEEEYALSDFHCVASTVTRDQLGALGIDPAKIWLVPYGADERIFHPAPQPETPARFRIIFAGELMLRKGLRTLLQALELAAAPDWEVDFYGALSAETAADRAAYHGASPLHFQGPVAQTTLAEAFRGGSVLVLPSLEEGFGLVVPQALNCGLPCLVSDRVGARDLIRPRENGSVFPVEHPAALLAELRWWAAHPQRPRETYGWRAPAETLIRYSELAHAS